MQQNVYCSWKERQLLVWLISIVLVSKRWPEILKASRRPQLTLSTGMVQNLGMSIVLSEREAALLAKFNKELEKIEYETCDSCLEEGFDLNLQDKICTSRSNDKGDPV
jgi:hypothetical protein